MPPVLPLYTLLLLYCKYISVCLLHLANATTDLGGEQTSEIFSPSSIDYNTSVSAVLSLMQIAVKQPLNSISKCFFSKISGGHAPYPLENL